MRSVSARAEQAAAGDRHAGERAGAPHGSIAGSPAERLGIPVEQVDVEQGDSDDGVPSFGAVGVALDDVGRRRRRRGDRRDHREGQAGRGACARGRRGRHRLSRRRVRDRRHRPPRSRCSNSPSARGRWRQRASFPKDLDTRRTADVAAILSQRGACRRSRDRPGTGDRNARRILRSTIGPSVAAGAGRRSGPGRRRPGRRSGIAGKRHLRSGKRPIAGRLVHGLRHAARRPTCPTSSASAPGPGDDQSARREGRRRGRDAAARAAR